MPITWKNVESRGVGDVARLLEGAQRSINSGGANFQKILTEGQATEDFNQGVRKDNANHAVKDVLSQFNSVEELEAAKQSGALARLMKEAGGSLADKDLLRSGASDRLGALRTNANQDYEYDQTQLARAEDPIERAARLAIVSDDDAGFERIASENPNLRNLATLRQEYVGAERGRLEQGRSDTRFNREEAATRTREQVSAAAQQMLATGMPVSEMKIRLQQQFSGQEGIDPQALAQSIGQVEAQHQSLLAPSYQDEAAAAAARAEAEILAAGQQRNADNVLANQAADYPVNEAFSFTDGQNVTVGDTIKSAIASGWDDDTWVSGTDVTKAINNSVAKLHKNKRSSKGTAVPMGKLTEMALNRMPAPNGSLDNNMTESQFYGHLEAVYNEWLTSEENRAKRDLNQRANTAATTAAQLAPLQAEAAARTENLNKLRAALYGN